MSSNTKMGEASKSKVEDKVMEEHKGAIKEKSTARASSNPYVCSVCGVSHTIKGKPFLELKQLKGHWMGKRGRDGHEGLFPEQDFMGEAIEEAPSIPKPPLGEDLTKRAKKPKEHEEPVRPVRPIAEEVSEEEPEQLVEEPIGEPLPTELDYLNTLLLEHGVGKRAVILRALDLREPTNFYVLVEAMTDVGVNKARQRRICEDYGAWMGRAIPPDIVDELSPDSEGEYSRQRSSRWSRRTEGRRGLEGRSELGGMADVFREVGQIYEKARPKETFQHREDDTYEKLYKDEKAKNEELRQQLTDSKIESLRSEFDAKLASKNDGVATMISKLEKPVSRLGDLMEKVVGGVFETEFPRKPPKRERKGKSGVVDMLLEVAPEYVLEK